MEISREGITLRLGKTVGTGISMYEMHVMAPNRSNSPDARKYETHLTRVFRLEKLIYKNIINATDRNISTSSGPLFPAISRSTNLYCKVDLLWRGGGSKMSFIKTSPVLKNARQQKTFVAARKSLVGCSKIVEAIHRQEANEASRAHGDHPGLDLCLSICAKSKSICSHSELIEIESRKRGFSIVCTRAERCVAVIVAARAAARRSVDVGRF